jgi:hypothetical protein
MQTSFTSKSTELLADGISITFRQVLKSRVRPILADAFRGIDYSITTVDIVDDLDDDHDESEEDTVTKRFTTSWHSLSRPLKRIMTKPTWDKLLAIALPYLSTALERRLWALNGRLSELGATKLERDVGGIVAVACGEGKYALRDSFQRCQQIIMVAGMEDEEWEEVEAEPEGEGKSILWVLSWEERAKARTLVLR